jgi:hypothetical protein
MTFTFPLGISLNHVPASAVGRASPSGHPDGLADTVGDETTADVAIDRAGVGAEQTLRVSATKRTPNVRLVFTGPHPSDEA